MKIGKKKQESSNVRKKPIEPIFVAIIAFIFAAVMFNVYSNKHILPNKSYYNDTLDVSLPIVFQIRNGKKLNEMRGYRNEQYSVVSNDTIMLLEKDRKLTLLIKKNGANVNQIEYEVRDKTSNKLLEKTKVDKADLHERKEEIETTLNIQNLIRQKTIYQLTVKMEIEGKEVYYFTNIMYRPKSKIDDAILQVEEFTLYTFDKEKAATLVKYFETSINRDQKEMYNVTLQQTFEQLTFANTNMKLVSNLYYNIYQAQEYSYNISVNYITKSGNTSKSEYFINRDDYVLRWGESRWYYMKFNRNTEELINFDDRPYNVEKGRFYTGVTNPNNLSKLESENKRFFAFSKEKEIYLYDNNNISMTNIFSYRTLDNESFEKISRDYDVKIMNIDDEGSVTYIVYGYNMMGSNEGYIGIGIYKYNVEENTSEEKLFIPIYTTYQSMKYDIDKLCVLKNNRLIFKSYNKVYSIDIDSAEVLILAENFEETKFAASDNNKFFAFNNDKEGKSKQINIYNIEDGKVKTINAEEGKNIEVVTFMNDDLFFGVFSDEDVWREYGKIIGRPSREIRVVNAISDKQERFSEEGSYFYNFVNLRKVLRYNKYKKEGTHYTYLTNDVIVSNYSPEDNSVYNYKEEFTKEKLRIGYFEIKLKDPDIPFKYKKNNGIARKQIEDTAIRPTMEQEETLYYVYDNGRLKAKLKNLSDGIDEIRDTYGYVKLNDVITCYNRANKDSISYLKKDDSILENLKGFEENIYLKENSTLVMNVTGVTERDIEYYISLQEKVVVFKNDMFQFFITGYDNNNYVLEYEDKERVLTPREEVKEAIIYGGYVLFAQLESLE